MKKGLVAAVTVLLILIGLACWLFWPHKNAQALAPLVTLPDGTSVRIVAVTYGTNHVIGTKAARMVARLPSMLQDVLSEVPGLHIVPAQSVTTPTPELLVWLDQRTNRPPASPGTVSMTAFLGDGSNFISGADAGLAGYTGMSLIYPLHFSEFPRRDRKITLNIFSHDAKGVVQFCNSLSFANPLYQTYPQWQAESLPVTKRAGDLEVTLQGVETGHDNSSRVVASKDGNRTVEYGTNRVDGDNGTVVDVKFHPLTNSTEVWQVAGVEISDATGNRAHNSGMSWTGGNNSPFAFTPGLWPSEAAWKLKLEVKKMEGFRPEEIFVFKNVPLGELDRTNALDLATNINGLTVTLRYICRRAPITNSAWSSTQFSDLHVALFGLAAGAEFDLLRMVTDTGKTNHPDSWTSSGYKRNYGFHEIPSDAQTADIIFAVQQSRTVEFTVKPELPKP
ncbi:MAG TPA: hypothetical protein VN281_20820 [Verrucomicrobiae bacterium]|nr:hypothetical protein [Verrucomicrobiae bacterium]